MSFSLFGKHSEGEEISVILDIGSASVGAALVLLNKKQIPKVLYSVRIPITIPEQVNEKDFTDSMINFVRKTLEQVTTEGIKHFNFRRLKKRDIQKVVCVYASPWFASETKSIHITQAEPILLTEKYVENLVKKEQKELTEKLGVSDEVSIIEQKIISTKLNGYLTSKPYGKEAHDIEMNMFLGVVSANITESMEETINSVLHPDEIVHHSFSLLAYRTITNLFPSESNSVIFDITGEVTDISIVDNDVITQTGSVPFGRNSLVRKISKERKVNNEIGLSLLHLYAQQKMEENLSRQVDSVVFSTLNTWQVEVSKIIPDLHEKTVFITADQDVSEIFKKYIMSSNPHKVIVLNEEHFEGVVETEKSIREDLFVSTIVFFLNDFFQEEN